MDKTDIYKSVHNIKSIINELIREKIKMSNDNNEIVEWSIEKNKDLTKILNDLENLINVIEDKDFE